MRNLARQQVFPIALTVWMGLVSTSIADTVDVGALFKEAEEAVEKLDGSIEKANMLDSLAKAHGKRADRQKALALVKRTLDVAFKIPRDKIAGNTRWIFYDLVEQAIEEQARLGDIEGALRSATALGDLGQQKIPEFGRAARGQARAGDVTGAWATCDRIAPRWGFRKAMALGDVADKLAELRRFDAAIQTADRIEQLLAKDKKEAKIYRARRNDALSTIAYERAKCGQTKEALLTVKRVNDDLTQVRTLDHVAGICIDCGDERGAREAVLMALPILARLKASARRAFWTLAVLQAKLGYVRGALETTSKFLDPPAKGYALMGISIAQMKAGDGASSAQMFKEGLALAKSPKVEDWYTLDDAASLQIQAGQFDRALEIARVVGKPRNILWQVSVGLAKAGDFQRALKIADSLKDDAYAKAMVLSEIAALQAKAAQPLARQTFQRAFDAAMSDKDLNALKVVGLRQLRAGYVNAAADTFHEVRKEAIQSKYDPEYLVDIGSAQAAGGDSSGALAWARSQSSPLFKAYGLVGVVEGLTQGPGE